MGKYFDELVSINESLDMELGKESGIVVAKNNFEAAINTYSKEGLSDGDCLIKAFNVFLSNNPNAQDKSIDDISISVFCKWLVSDPNDTELYLEDSNEDITIPKDSLTDDQKKELLKDKGVDAKTVDGMKDSKELDSALDATMNNDAIKNESKDVSMFLIRMDDDDLDMHGYVEFRDNIEELHLTDEMSEVAKYGSIEKTQAEIQGFCDRFHYDPSTFKVEPIEPDEDGKNDGIDDGEGWVSLDPMHQGATTIPQ